MHVCWSIRGKQSLVESKKKKYFPCLHSIIHSFNKHLSACNEVDWCFQKPRRNMFVDHWKINTVYVVQIDLEFCLLSPYHPYLQFRVLSGILFLSFSCSVRHYFFRIVLSLIFPCLITCSFSLSTLYYKFLVVSRGGFTVQLMILMLFGPSLNFKGFWMFQSLLVLILTK